MPDIRITEDQRDRLRALQAEIESELVGRYGHVRPRDAVEFLLDRYEADVRAVDDGFDEAVEREAADLVAELEDGEGSDAEATGSDGADAADAGDGEDGADDERVDDSDDADDADDSDDGDATGGPIPAGAADGDTTLNSVMSLMDDNDDKWREGDGEEGRYVVDLPDGSTEGARTKEDVRALLFKHYR